MEINGFKLKYTPEELARMVNQEMRQIPLIDKNFPAYAALSDGDKRLWNIW